MGITKDVGQYSKVKSASRLKRELSEGFIVLKPLGGRVITEVVKEEEKTVGRIVLVSVAKEKPQAETVVAAGEDRLLENGEKVPAAIEAGDQVMFEKHAGTEAKYEGKEYLIVAGKDIMVIAEQIRKIKKQSKIINEVNQL